MKNPKDFSLVQTYLLLTLKNSVNLRITSNPISTIIIFFVIGHD
jgi:hypothetical protein